MDFEDIYYTCKNLPKDIKLGKYSAKNYRAEGVSDLAHAVKSDNPDMLKKWIAINRIARHIIDQNILTKKDYIVPAPQHTGRADYTLKIAKIISEETGCKIADVLGCKPRDTLYNLKKKNGAKSIEDSGLYLLTDKFPKYNVWFLDNVTATGKTFDDARKLIPHLKPLIYSISPRLKVKMKNRKPYFIRENNENKIKALISKIEEYKELCGNVWVPQAWKVAYSKVPEGLKLTIDTDEWFDKENPLGHLIDFILDIYDSDYNSSVKELTGINVYSDVKFLSGEKSDYAIYLIKNNESSSLKEAKLEEGPWPKWKQKILDDLNALCEEVENNYTGDYWENEKLKGLSFEDILSIVKKANKKFGFSELQEEHASIEIWKGIHDDEIGISYWASDEEKEEFYAHKFKQEVLDKCKELNHKLNKEIWPALEEEYQSKYGIKRKPQPYIKDPTDASEIFDKVSALKYESQKRIEKTNNLNENRSLKMDFKRIYESLNQGVNLSWIWDNKKRFTLSDLEILFNKVKSTENEWDGYYPGPRVYVDYINDSNNSLFFGYACDGNIEVDNFSEPDHPIDVELFFDEKKVSVSELKNILLEIKSKEDDYDEYYLDLEKIEGNKLFFTEGYEERD